MEERGKIIRPKIHYGNIKFIKIVNLGMTKKEEEIFSTSHIEKFFSLLNEDIMFRINYAFKNQQFDGSVTAMDMTEDRCFVA